MAEILIVEDEELLAEMLSLRLGTQGHTIHLAVNGRDGVDKAQELNPDLVLMDMHMPVMNGKDATKTLRGHGYEGLIVAVTASARTEELGTALEVGCDDCITKPIGRDFEGRIAEILEGGRP